MSGIEVQVPEYSLKAVFWSYFIISKIGVHVNAYFTHLKF
jgi:hypothetical protein